jgi:hypothetical protein
MDKWFVCLASAFAAMVANAGPVSDAAPHVNATLNEVVPAPADKGVSTPGAVEIRAGQDAGAVSISLTILESSKAASRGIFSTWTFTAAAPLNKDSADTTLGTLDGLTSATTLELKWSNFVAQGMRQPDKTRLSEICNEAKRNFKDLNGKEASEDACDDPSWLKANLSDDLYREHDGNLWEPSAKLWVYGLSGKIGHKAFKFVDPNTLGKTDTDEVPWSARAFVAWHPNRSRLLVAASLEYQQSFKDADSQVLCPAGAAPVTCVGGPIGQPKEEKKQLASLEFRKRFLSWPIAISMSATHDFESHVNGLDMPIYLVVNDKGALIGGLRLGWRDDTDDFGIGVFVGKTFSALMR